MESGADHVAAALGYTRAQAVAIWGVLQHESVGSALDVLEALEPLLLDDFGLSSVEALGVANLLFETAPVWQRQQTIPSSSGSLDRWLEQRKWKREHMSDEDRFYRPYRHVLGAGRCSSAPELELEQRPFGPEGFASTVWDSSIVLARMLEALPPGSFAGKRCVELGAGCGLVGLVLCAAGADVVLTDLPCNLRLLRANARANTKHLKGRARVAALSWGEPLGAELRGRWDVVVATDVFYARGAMGKLLESLETLAGPETRVMLAAGRNRHADEEFFEQARGGWAVEAVPRSEMHPTFSCDDVAVWRLTKL